MDPNLPTTDSDRRITRRDLEAVIRRAAELCAADADAADAISEAELLRIASEIGLPARHVRQALLELPLEPAEPSLLDRFVGPALVGAVRIVPCEADLARLRLEDYLTTREFLQPTRRQAGRASYVPADDAVSKLSRIFSRPSGRYHLAHARRVLVAVQLLEPGWAHVRLDLDLADRRRGSVAGGAVAGGLFGALLGAGLAATGAATGGLFDPVGIGAAMSTFAATMMAGVGGGLAIARASFRRRLAGARLEVEGLLDRLERGERLEPPPAPWRRRLQARLSGQLPSGR